MNDSMRPEGGDRGPEPFVANLVRETMANPYFRTARWTGKHLQLTLMNIRPGEDIGLEIHPHLDQFLFLVSGRGVVYMDGVKRTVNGGDAIIIPAGTKHNVVNVSRAPIKLFSVYAPPQHPYGTVHKTRAIAEMEENH